MMGVSIAINTNHDSSLSVVEDGKLVVHLIEERYRHLKHCAPPCHVLKELEKYVDHIDAICFTDIHYKYETTAFSIISSYFHCLSNIDVRCLNQGKHVRYFVSPEHHKLHTGCAFSHSGFDEALCVVLDGAGATFENGKENQSVYECTKDGYKCIEKNIVNETNIGAGYAYASITQVLGFECLDCGKTMGLSAYGKEDKDIPQLISVEEYANKNFKLLKTENLEHFGYTDCELTIDNQSKLSHENLAYRIQKDYEDYLIATCKRVLSKSKIKNLILTGGCALNCVANYKLLKELPDDINLYVEPVCDDSGVSLGGAYHTYDPSCKVDFKLKDLYLGRPLMNEYKLLDGEDEYEVTGKDVSSLISKGNLVGIIQGRSEIGPRALGNRSLLFDPRVKDGKDIVNRVKKREYFRPFAGTVLLEHARDWFDMDRLEESPFMMYAVDTLPEKIDLIPSIVHVDGTCRIQTVTREQNKHYYDLISEFYKQTGVPILFNTSFNLAGDTMVDTIEDGLWTLRNSEIEYMYLPETSSLIYVPNK